MPHANRSKLDTVTKEGRRDADRKGERTREGERACGRASETEHVPGKLTLRAVLPLDLGQEEKESARAL